MKLSRPNALGKRMLVTGTVRTDTIVFKLDDNGRPVPIHPIQVDRENCDFGQKAALSKETPAERRQRRKEKRPKWITRLILGIRTRIPARRLAQA